MTAQGPSLAGRVAVVTGAGQGLGRAEALALARAGAAVVVNDYGVALDGTPDTSRADAVVAEIVESGGQALVHQGDVSDWDQAEDLVRSAVDAFGTVDIVVNNAGILRDRMLVNMSAEEWDAVIRVHLRGHFCVTRHAVAHWRSRSKAAGAPVYARVVNTSSEAFLFGSPGQPNYAAAKAGIVALTMSTARGCAQYGVLANVVCPRASTRMTGLPAEGEPAPFAPDLVAPLVVFLAGPEAARVSGQVFVAYGGMVALLAPPTVDQRWDAPEGGWTQASLADRLTPLFEHREPVVDGYFAAKIRALDDGSWRDRSRS
jgi:NAD(P)-dependent dehydrogenase (short-subunit alcohol dehydrogenase family)